MTAPGGRWRLTAGSVVLAAFGFLPLVALALAALLAAARPTTRAERGLALFAGALGLGLLLVPGTDGRLDAATRAFAVLVTAAFALDALLRPGPLLNRPPRSGSRCPSSGREWWWCPPCPSRRAAARCGRRRPTGRSGATSCTDRRPSPSCPAPAWRRNPCPAAPGTTQAVLARQPPRLSQGMPQRPSRSRPSHSPFPRPRLSSPLTYPLLGATPCRVT